VLGGDTCEGYIFITARVFLDGTPAMGTYGFHYCPSVLGGETYDGEALKITPIDQAHKFVSPPSGDAIMDFVNELGYTEARLLDMIGPDTQFFKCFGA
ncbi:hypothetical protein Tco_1581250, partial [Tanacetum coccineum]